MAISKAAVGLAVGLCASACGGSSSSPTTPTPAGSSVTYAFLSAIVNPPVLAAGETAFARVEGWTITAGDRIYGPISVSAWRSSSTAVASVTNTGIVTAAAPGIATLTATSDAGPYSTTVSVFGDSDVEGLTVTCGDIPPGIDGVFCSAAARTRVGDGPVKARWTSSRPDVGFLATDGSTPSAAILVLRKNAGQTVMTATYGAFTGTATIEVRD